MSYGRTQLHTLLTDSSITDLLTDVRFLWYDNKITDKEFLDGTKVGAQDATINYYRAAPVNGGLEYMRTVYYTNCRAKSMEGAEAIASAVHAKVNRYSSGGYHFISSVLSTIPPLDPTDNYNAPIEIVSRARTFN